MFKTREYIYSLSIYLSSNAKLNGKLERFKCFVVQLFCRTYRNNVNEDQFFFP